MKPFTWTLIGASSIAKTSVVPALLAQPHTRIASVVSGSPASAVDVARAAGASRAASLEEALSDPSVDAVYISSVNGAHHQQALAAIAAGKHVMCEKPVALRTAQAEEMVRAAHSENVLLATNHHMRNSVPHLKIREAVLHGDLGEIVAVSVRHAVQLPASAQGWRTKDRAAGAGVIYDITVHDADVLRFVLAEDPVTVYARATSGRVTDPGIDETVLGTAHFGGGVDANFFESFVAGHAATELAVFGTEASMIGTGIQSMQPAGTLKRWVAGTPTEIDLGEREDLYTAGFRRFQSVVRGDEPAAAATGLDGYWSLAFAEAALSSVATSQPVDVAVPPSDLS